MASVVALATAFIPDIRAIVGYVFRALFLYLELFVGTGAAWEWREWFLLNPFALIIR